MPYVLLDGFAGRACFARLLLSCCLAGGCTKPVSQFRSAGGSFCACKNSWFLLQTSQKNTFLLSYCHFASLPKSRNRDLKSMLFWHIIFVQDRRTLRPCQGSPLEKARVPRKPLTESGHSSCYEGNSSTAATTPSRFRES